MLSLWENVALKEGYRMFLTPGGIFESSHPLWDYFDFNRDFFALKELILTIHTTFRRLKNETF